MSQPPTVGNSDNPASHSVVGSALAKIRAMGDPVDRLRAARELEAELLDRLDDVRTVLSEAAALAHADRPETLDERQQAPWG